MTHQTTVAAIDEALDRATERFERRLAESIAGLRIDMADDMADLRVELVKWSFVFWTGQVVAIAALLALIR